MIPFEAQMVLAAKAGTLTEKQYHAFMLQAQEQTNDPNALVSLVYLGEPEWRKRYLNGRTTATVN